MFSHDVADIREAHKRRSFNVTHQDRHDSRRPFGHNRVLGNGLFGTQQAARGISESVFPPRHRRTQACWHRASLAREEIPAWLTSHFCRKAGQLWPMQPRLLSRAVSSGCRLLFATTKCSSTTIGWKCCNGGSAASAREFSWLHSRREARTHILTSLRVWYRPLADPDG